MARFNPSITINSIAKLAGVTKGTVSKILNNYPGINEKTRERVLKIITDVGYEPNSAAQTLVSRKTGNIGLIIPHSPEHSLSGAYWSSQVSAIGRETTSSGYSLVLLLPQAEGQLHDLFKSIIAKKRVDGLIIGGELMDKHYLATLLSTETPFVMLGRNPEFKHHCVDIDNRAAGEAIARYLIDRGYTRPVFLGGPAEYYYITERAEGFQDALRRAGREPIDPVYIPYDDRPAMERAVTQVVERHKPDAAVSGAGGDFMFDALTILKGLGKTPPSFGFATFDDYRHLEFFTPRITSVRQPVSALGAEAVKILVDLMGSRGSDAGPDRVVILDAEIVPRESCGEVLKG